MNISAWLWRISKKLSRKNIYEFLSEQLLLIAPNSIVLNVGSGGGIEEHIFHLNIDKRFTLISSDIDPLRHPDVVDDIVCSSFQDDFFDTIIIMEVLEHVADPVRAGKEIHRILKSGGRVILSVPFIFPLHDRPYDFYRFTKYGLAHIFREFDHLEIRERNSWTETILVLLVRLIGEPHRQVKIVSSMFLPIIFVCVPIFVLIAKLFPTDFITTGYVVSAVKR